MKLFTSTVISSFFIAGYLCIDKYILTELSEGDLDDYSNTEVTKKCLTGVNDTLIITGYNVKFSDLFRSNGKLYVELCPNTELKVLKIFALNKLFIDMDVDMVGEEIHLTIIARAWIVLGRRRINLNGLAGKEHEPPSAKNGAPVDPVRRYYLDEKCFSVCTVPNKILKLLSYVSPLCWKYCNDTRPLRQGEDGLPGNPGGPAGSFFGIGDNFFNGDYLQITAQGGDGGPGQNGGNGGDVDLRYALIPYLSPDIYYRCSSQGIARFREEHFVGGKISLIDSKFELSSFICNIYHEVITRMEIFQFLSVDDLELSGDGGQGGEGGNSGNISVIQLIQMPSIKNFKNNSGRRGGNGKGGIKGKTGGKTFIVRCEIGKDKPIIPIIPSKDCIYLSKEIDISSSYKVNENIFPEDKYLYSSLIRNITLNRELFRKSLNISIPKPKMPRQGEPPYKVLNEFKAFLRESSNEPKWKLNINAFYDKIDESVKTSHFYNTHGFIEEYKGLEGQFYVLNKKVDFIPYYTQLLRRVVEFIEKHKNDSPGFEESKEVLLYMQTALLGRLFYLKENAESVLVIKVGDYLQLTKKRFDEITNQREIQTSIEKLNEIDALREIYNSKLMKEIEEAHNLIKTDIMPKVHKIKDLPDISRAALKEEFKKMATELEEAQGKAESEKSKAIGKLVGNVISNVLITVGAALSLFFPIAGAVAAGVGGMVKGAMGAINIEPQDVPQLKEGVEQFQGGRKSDLARESAKLGMIFDGILKIANNDPENLNSLSVGLKKIEKNITKVSSFSGVKTLMLEMGRLVKKTCEDFEPKHSLSNFNNSQIALRRMRPKPKSDQKKEDSEDKLETINNVFAIGGGLVGLVVDLINDGTNIQKINDVISQIEEKLKKLKEFEEATDRLLYPLLDKMAETLVVVSGKLYNLSSVALIVKGYEITNALESTTQYISNLLKEFETEVMINNAIKGVQGAFSTLFKVYNQIRNLEHEIDLGNHITEMFSVATLKIKITDKEFTAAVVDLKVAIGSNLVLKYYQSAIHAFKQFVFPFAHSYFHDLITPTHLLSENNMNTAVMKAEEQINKLIEKLALYKSTIGLSSGMTGNTSFNSFEEPYKPFYVWKYDHHREMISKLLSGEEVAAFADITESDPFKDAIKFNEIAIHLKSKNKMIQKRVDKCLKKYEVTLVHFGNSFYRYNKMIYLITSSNLIVWLSFINKDGVPARASSEYYQLKQGDYMLSPYALWKLQITHIDEKGSFEDLKKYKNSVDIELIGAGSFIDNRRIKGRDLKEKLYYQPLDTFKGNED